MEARADVRLSGSSELSVGEVVAAGVRGGAGR